MSRRHLPAHIPQLDGLRAVAASLVLLQHSAHDFPKVRVFECVDRYGMAGIQLFFVLSGFLITNILLDTKNEPDYFRNFFARRALRLYPLYYGTLGFVMIGAVIFHRFSGIPWWIYLLYLSNLFSTPAGAPAALGTLWSLGVEEQFYLVWAVFVRLFTERAVVRVSACTVILIPLIRLLGLLSFHNTLLQVDALAAGALIACFQPQLTKWRTWAAVAAFTFPLGIALPHGLLNEISREFQVISAAGILVLLLTVSEASVLRQLFSNRFARYVGTVSYGIYLLHSYVFNAFRATRLEQNVARNGSFIEASLLLLVEYSIVLTLASISYYAFERPFLRLKRYFSSRPAKNNTPASAPASHLDPRNLQGAEHVSA